MMKCIECDKEAQYFYVYGVPLTGITFAITGGSFCRQHLEEAKRKELAGLKEWVEFQEKITKVLQLKQFSNIER